MDDKDARLPIASSVEIEFRNSGLATLTVRGEHDLSTAPRLASVLADAGARADVIVDLEACTFMDSTIIKTLVGAQRRLASHGRRLSLVIPPAASAVRRIVEITALDQILPVFESRRAASAAFREEET